MSRIASGYVSFCVRRGWLVLLLALGLSGLAVSAATKLELRTDLAEMLAQSERIVRAKYTLNDAIERSVGRIIRTFRARLDAAGAETEKRVAAITKQQAEGTIGETLRAMNRPESIAADAAWYADLLRYGAGDEQPGAELLAAWGKRNLLICARLVQAAKPGDHVLVFYGAGHAHLLRQCVGEVPGFELVEPNAYL